MASEEVIVSGVAEGNIEVVERILPLGFGDCQFECLPLVGERDIMDPKRYEYIVEVRLDIPCLPVDRSFTLVVAAVVRCDNQSTVLFVTRVICISCRRCIDEAHFYPPISALHILQMMFHLLQIHDRLL